MAVADTSIDPLIIKYATQEFLEKGYKGATLRSICEKADVTTGAMYKRYKNKEELFGALVEPVYQLYEQEGQNSVDRSYEAKERDDMDGLWEHSLESYQNIMRGIYSQEIGFRLLLCSAGGSRYESFVEDIVEKVTDETMKFCESYYDEGRITKVPDRDGLHIILTAHWSCLLEPVKHGFTLEKALEFCVTIKQLFNWENIFEF